MIKKCIGCGVTLQDSAKDELGYTPDLKKAYCMRCFRLKNYGEKKEGETVSEKHIITKVNNSKGLVFFLIDYLNLNKYTLALFKQIKLPKVLVISKSDTLRRDMKFSKIKTWLNKVYAITEDIVFISSKNNFQNLNIFKYMTKNQSHTCFIMGLTNAGKSTFINSILKQNGLHKEIVTSNKPNTTLDFIKLKINDYTIYDTPGFDYLSLNSKIIDSEIKPITYNITKPVTIHFNDTIDIFFAEPNHITIYTTDNSVKRIYNNTVGDGHLVTIPENYDLVLPGLGFINIKSACQITSTIANIEVRASISGDNYE
ncbi:MAG: GTPase RsgA [Bacilli bacterium]|nr:GTPase RsgA [Bacilli bacterium]